MALIAVAFVVGIIFALGLAVSEMINPSRVIGFLDVAGRWDPTLAARHGWRACRNRATFSVDSAPVKTNSCCAI